MAYLYYRQNINSGTTCPEDLYYIRVFIHNNFTERMVHSLFNSDQGSQYTSNAFTALLEANGIRISMDGVGRALDNIFIERFWKTLKYEDFFIRDYRSLKECREGIKRYIDFYNQERPHQSLDSLTPDEVYKRGVVIFFNFTARSYLPHYSWSGCFSLMENMDFEECVFIFKNGYSREKYLELKAA